MFDTKIKYAWNGSMMKVVYLSIPINCSMKCFESFTSISPPWQIQTHCMQLLNEQFKYGSYRDFNNLWHFYVVHKLCWCFGFFIPLLAALTYGKRFICKRYLLKFCTVQSSSSHIMSWQFYANVIYDKYCSVLRPIFIVLAFIMICLMIGIEW